MSSSKLDCGQETLRNTNDPQAGAETRAVFIVCSRVKQRSKHHHHQ